MTIEELIANGQRKLDERTTANAKAQAEQEAERERVRRATIAQFARDVKAYTPDPLLQYLVFNVEDGWEPGYNENALIRVPGCSDITWSMRRLYEPDKKDGRECDYVWRPADKTIKYWVQHARELYMDYEFDQWVARHETLETSDIEIALAWARGEFTREQEYAAEVEKRNAKLVDDVESQREREESDKARAKSKVASYGVMCDALITDLEHDPVAFRLLQAMSEVIRQHEAWEERLSLADERVSEINEAHETAMQRAGERAQESLRSAQRDADAAKRLEAEAHDEAEAAARKLKQAQRGW